MGKLVGGDISTSGVKKVLNSYTDNYLDGTKDYSKFFESAPNFVTYYAIDAKSTTVDRGLGGYIETIGNESPLRFNRVNNLPIFGVEEINPQHDFDEDNGLREVGESQAVILPGTIQPQPNDHFTFTYHEQDRTHLRVYRVTDVNTSSFNSKTFFQISYEEDEGVDLSILDGKQKVATYETIYKDIGSEKVAVIPEEKYKMMKIIASVVEQVSSAYIDEYYDEVRNIFVRNNPENLEINVYDGNLHTYINNNHVFVNEKNFLANIYLTDQQNHSRREYRKSLYGAIEKYNSGTKVNFPTNYISKPEKSSNLNSVLGVYGGIYTGLEWSRDSGEDLFGVGHLDDYFNEFEDKNSLNGLPTLLRILLQSVINPGTLTMDELDEFVEWSLDNIGESISDYVATPIILASLEDYYNTLNTDESMIYQDIN